MPLTSQDLNKLAREMRIAPPTPPQLGEPVDLTVLFRNTIDVGQLPPAPNDTVVLGRLNALLETLSDGTTPPAINVLADIRWTVALQRRTDPGMPAGTGFIAPDGLNKPTIKLFLEPLVVESRNGIDLPPPSRYVITATATLAAGGVSSEEVTLPALTLPLPVLPIPSMLLLFRHPHFKTTERRIPGFVALLVPVGSPIKATDALDQRLSPLTSIVTALKGFGFARFIGFSRVLNTALRALSSQPGIGFKAATTIDNLEDVRLKGGGPGAEIINFNGRVEADNEVSSLLLLGVPGTKVDFYNRHNQNDAAGGFSLTTGTEMFVKVPNLADPEPACEPAGRLTLLERARSFDNSLGSLQFR